MKIVIQKKYLSDHPEQFLRQKASYAHIHSYHTDHDSYVRRLTRDHYPRLHMYVKDLGEKVEFNLHLDQKQVSYQGNHAHNAEYDGAVVEQEIIRLKGLLSQSVPAQARAGLVNTAQAEKSPVARLGHGTYEKQEPEEKRGLFKRIFNL